MAKSTPAARPTRATSALLTGGGSGSALAAFAQTLPDPYKTWLSLASPAVSAVIAACWPLLLNWASAKLAAMLSRNAKKRAIRAMDEFLVTQQKRLETEQLDPTTKDLILKRISEVQRADAEHSIIAIYTDS